MCVSECVPSRGHTTPHYSVRHLFSFLVPVPLLHLHPHQAKALHGEQYLEIRAPLPPSAKVVTTAQVVDVQDKGKGAVAVSAATQLACADMLTMMNLLMAQVAARLG